VKLWTIYFNNVEAIKPERIIPCNGKNQWVSFNLSEAAIANKGAADLFKKMAQAATSPDPSPEPSELVEAAPAPFAPPVTRPVDLDGEELCPSAKSAKNNKAEEVLGDGGAAAGSTTEQSGMEQLEEEQAPLSPAGSSASSIVNTAELVRGMDLTNQGLLYELMDWPTHCLGRLEEYQPGTTTALANTLRKTTHSTCYSGIDTPGVALHMLAAQLEGSTACGNIKPEHIHACDILKDSRSELITSPMEPQCLFKDVEDWWTDSMKRYLNKCGKIGLNALMPYIRMPHTVLRKTASCTMHQSGCGCPMNDSTIHVAGTSCIDDSPIGAHGGAENGKATRAFAAWATQRRRQEAIVIIHENSHLFDPQILHKVLGDKYIILSKITCPTSLGWPVRRRRRWSVLVHREFAISVTSRLAPVISMFHRPIRSTWRVFMVAEKEELISELQWASNRPSSLWPESKDIAEEFQRDIENTDHAGVFLHFREALTATELKWLQRYEGMTHGTDYVHKLNQNPMADRGISSTSTVLHTILRNTSIDYSS
ncbi:unnamed protein product, partial [Prorocentrum cordatum]